MPLTATLAAVSTVAHRITTSRSRLVFAPMERASSSPKVSRLIRQRKISSGARPMSMGTAAKATTFIRVPERLPMSQ